MKPIHLFSKNIILPLSDLITGQSIYKNLLFLEKSQNWPRKQLDEYPNKKLRDLIQHSYSNVPFYHELFQDLRIKPEEIQTKDDLHKIPIITKDDLKTKKNKHLAVNITRKKLLLRSSSGSTGEPFQFYVTKYSESLKIASAIRAWQWMGYRLGDKYVKVSMNPRTSRLKKIQDKMNNSLYLSATQLTPQSFRTLAEQIELFNPQIIRCYPVPLAVLSEQLRTMHGKYTGKSLVAINTTGSTLHDETRTLIEQTFNASVFDSYSCEGGTNFSQCNTSGFYHPAEEYAISEFISDAYTTADPDNPKRHITTDLHNYASPFIRYDTQDYVVLGSDELCSCGRHFRNVKNIKGRDSDVLITPSGKYLIVENFVAYFEWIEEVDQIQVVQNKRNEIIIKMIVNNRFSENVFSKVLEYWKSYIGSDVEVVLEVVEKIELTPTGKRRTVIRNPKIKIDGGI